MSGIRLYGLITTILLAGWLTMETSFALTGWDVIGILFVTIMVAFLSGVAFILLTEPKKKQKAHWEQAGTDNELSVMVMGRRK